jgi:type III secretion protein V
VIWIERALARVRRAGDAVLALGVLAVVLLLVAPLPPALLDLCIALNLAVAATVLVVTLLARDALRFASFPTLLLLTTLYRLALSVSSTRLVLSRGEAGQVIQAFGRVVVQGNYVVGAVIFAILTLVQLLVVAKGAERVAEVAARFTLDGLPGKQLSIDADLRAGLIDAAEARRKRRALERESQLYGAMDGALKFVKGDALAGIAIALVNVAGGLVAGMARGMAVEAAARRYALLAIGDGLVSQIPSLLIAISAGLAVTRVAAEEEGEGLAQEIGRQVLAEPRVLWVVAALLSAVGLAPGMPAGPFLLLAAVSGGGAALSSRRRPSHSRDGGSSAVQEGRALAPGSSAAGGRLSLELAPDLLELAVSEGDRFTREVCPALRDRLWQELGVELPELTIRSGPLPAGHWRLLLDEVPAGGGRTLVSERVALVAPAEIALVGIAHRIERDPLHGRPLAVVSCEDAERAAALGPLRHPLERVLVGAAAALRRNAHLLIGIQEAQALLERVEEGSPALVREVAKQVTAACLAEVLRRLVEEGVSIRPLPVILEALLERGGGARSVPALAEDCRRALRRQLAHQHAEQGVLEPLLLDPAVEAAIREGAVGELAVLDAALERALLEQLGVEQERRGGRLLLLASQDVRRAARNLFAVRFPSLRVLGYDELPPEYPIRPRGRLALPVAAAEAPAA